MSRPPCTRRRLLQSLGTGFGIGLAGCAESAPNTESPTEPETGTDDRTTTPTPTPTTAYEWQYGIASDVVGIADGFVFGREAGPDTAGAPDADGSIVGLDTNTGDRRWSYGSVGRSDRFGTPLVDDALYVSRNDDTSEDPPGDVHCVEFDGTERWVQSGDVSVASIHTTAETVYATRYDNVITAYEKADGSKAGQFDPATVTGYSGDTFGSPSIALGDGVLYVFDQMVIAVEQGTNDVLWTYGSEATSVRVRALAGGTVFVATPDGIGAVATGSVQWFERSPDAEIIGLAADWLLTLDAREGRLEARDPATGDVSWSAAAPGVQGATLLAHTETTAFLTTFPDEAGFRTVALEDGAVRWTPDFAWNQVVVTGTEEGTQASPQLYFSSEDGTLRRCGAAGEVTWTATLTDIDPTSTVVGDGRIVVGSDTGLYGIAPS